MKTRTANRGPISPKSGAALLVPQIDEAAVSDPDFVRWWHRHRHEFPDSLKAILATGFVAGNLLRSERLESVEEEIANAVRITIRDEFRDLQTRGQW